MKSLFIPTKKNNYHAYLLRRPMLAIYLIVLILVNMIIGGLSMTYSKAAIDFSALYRMHNEQRDKRNLNQLTINPLLINSATAKAEAMLKANCWSHYCPDGKSPWDFFDAEGYTYIYAGENLAEGFSDNEAVMAAWMDSPTHRDNILNTKFTEFGIGFAHGDYQGMKNNTVIVVHFGNRFDSINAIEQVINSNNDNSNVIITQPNEGASFKNNNFTIAGEVQNGYNVDINVNNEYLGSADVNNGLFTYRPQEEQLSIDGNYILTASTNYNNKLYTSNPVNISIDTKAPNLKTNNFAIKKATSGFIFEITASDASAIKLVNLNLDFQKSANDIWQLYLESFDKNITPTLIISAVDKAGNSSTIELRTEKAFENIVTDNTITTDSAPLIRFKNQASIVNFSFLIFMSGLFSVDYLVLQKNGLTGKQRTQSHLNILLFVVLAIMVILGGTSGEILSGITIN